MTLMEDGFFSRSNSGIGYVGLSFEQLWEAIAEDAIPDDAKMETLREDATGDVIMEFDRSKIVLEGVSLQPALQFIYVNKRLLERFLGERELDAVFLKEDARQQTEMMIWFLRTLPMMKDL